MKTLRLLVIGGFTSYRALFSWASPAMFVGSLLIAPVTQLLFFVYLGRTLGVQNDNYFIIANAILTCSTACVFGGTMAVANESRYGTMGIIVMSSRSTSVLFLGRALPYVANGLLVSVFTLFAGSAIFRVRIEWHLLPALLGIILLASASCTLFGLTLGSLGLRLRDVWVIPNVAFILLLILSQTDVPAAYQPGWLRVIGSFVPITHAAQAAQRVTGSATGGLAMPLLGEAAVGIGWGVLAIVLLRVFEVQGRRSATLEYM